MVQDVAEAAMAILPSIGRLRHQTLGRVMDMSMDGTFS